MLRKKFIQQCYDLPDFEKAKAFVGEERVWGGIRYKKVDQGRWVKVVEQKNKISEKEVSSTSFKKKINQEIKSKQLEKQNFLEDVKRQWEEENGEINNSRKKVQFGVYLSKFQPHREFWDKIDSEIQDLEEELKEISEFERREREKTSGRKELQLNDQEYDQFRKQFLSQRQDIAKMRDYVSAKESLGEEVSTQDYFLSTNTLFKNHLNITEVSWDADLIKQEWERLKENPDLEHTLSPKSESEYLVNHKTGDVYRLANHWGRCASCVWGYDGEGFYGIGHSNVKDFERNDNGSGYVNKNKVEEELNFCRSQLKNIKQLKDKVDFDVDVKKDIKDKVSYINNILNTMFYKNLEESRKILEEYKDIINI